MRTRADIAAGFAFFAVMHFITTVLIFNHTALYCGVIILRLRFFFVIIIPLR